jgi:N-acetylglucosamine kinase-like BadF-type ATPase
VSLRIGVDGGGTKTECILVGAGGRIEARTRGRGCNPSRVGRARARAILEGELRRLRKKARGEPIAATLLCMAGAPEFWREVAAGLKGFGRVRAVDDSRPVLELAAGGGPGMVLHAGTGSFVAARTRTGRRVYAGGLGWRLGDPGSGEDIGRRAAARGLLELQGWAPRSGLAGLVRRRTGRSGAPGAKAAIYAEAPAGGRWSEWAPEVLRLAARGDRAAAASIAESAAELARLAGAVAARVFPGKGKIAAGLSGPILAHPAARRGLPRGGRLAFAVLTEPPIEGVRRMLARL